MHEAIREKAAAAGLLQTGHVRLDREERFARMLALSEEFAELPVLDGREADDIIGYDEYGVPR